MPDERDDLGAVGALAEPNRRILYEYVVGAATGSAASKPPTRWASSGASPPTTSTGSPTTACSRSDYRRLGERRGPGAGRPSKVYRRTPSDISVSLPPRHYELAGHVLAEAADRSSRSGVPIGRAIEEAARRAGAVIAAEAKEDLGRRAGVDTRRRRLFAELRARGFEPETLADGVTVLHNCPFHQLAQQHTELICGMNLCLLDTILDELDGTDLRAALEPEDGYCCVRFHPESPVTGRRSPE